jgi:hypothetical protein
MGSGEAGQPAGREIPYTAILVVGISAVLVVVIVIALIATCRSPSRNVGLNAAVTFDGAQFVISNKDNFDWTNVKMEVNEGVAIPGFSYNVPKIAAEGTYTVFGNRFFTPDGSQFNPTTTKIVRFTIACDTPKGPASWSATWQ